MAPAPLVGEAFFPLDEELGLSSGGLTPRGEQTLVRLASWMPFEPAREMLARATSACFSEISKVCRIPSSIPRRMQTAL